MTNFKKLFKILAFSFFYILILNSSMLYGELLNNKGNDLRVPLSITDIYKLQDIYIESLKDRHDTETLLNILTEDIDFGPGDTKGLILKQYRIKAIDAIVSILKESQNNELNKKTFGRLEEFMQKDWSDVSTYIAVRNGFEKFKGLAPHLYNKSKIAKIAVEYRINHVLPEGIEAIFEDPYFKGLPEDPYSTRIENEENLWDYYYVYSLALSAYRLLKRCEMELTRHNIKEAIDYIIAKRNSIFEKKVFAKEVKVINIFGDGEMFSDRLKETKEFLRDIIGISEEKINNNSFQGNSSKETALKAISNTKGPLTIYIHDHGSKDKISSFSVKDIGDALIKRGDLEEVTLLLSACKAYNYTIKDLDEIKNFGNDLVTYLLEKEASTIPIIVTQANKNRYAKTTFIEYSNHILSRGKSEVTMEDFFRFEWCFFPIDDFAIFCQKDKNDPKFKLASNYVEIGFWGNGGEVQVSDLDRLAQGADIIIKALNLEVNPLVLDVNDEGINATSYNIGKYNVNVQIDNSIPYIFEFSDNGKTIRINIENLNTALIRLRINAEKKKGVLEGILVHELAEAVALQLGMNKAEAHTSGMMATAYFVQGNAELRNEIAKLWAYGEANPWELSQESIRALISTKASL